MRLHLLALLPLALLAFACGDSSLAPTDDGGISNNPPPPINGSDGDAFAPPAPTPEGGGPNGGAPGGGSPGGGGGPSGPDGRPPAAPVPEPGTLLLVGSGLAGLAFASRRRRREEEAAAEEAAD